MITERTPVRLTSRSSATAANGMVSARRREISDIRAMLAGLCLERNRATSAASPALSS